MTLLTRGAYEYALMERRLCNYIWISRQQGASLNHVIWEKETMDGAHYNALANKFWKQGGPIIVCRKNGGISLLIGVTCAVGIREHWNRMCSSCRPKPMDTVYPNLIHYAISLLALCGQVSFARKYIILLDMSSMCCVLCLVNAIHSLYPHLHKSRSNSTGSRRERGIHTYVDKLILHVSIILVDVSSMCCVFAFRQRNKLTLASATQVRLFSTGSRRKRENEFICMLLAR
jgi:hypothetical protein